MGLWMNNIDLINGFFIKKGKHENSGGEHQSFVIYFNEKYLQEKIIEFSHIAIIFYNIHMVQVY